MAKKSTRIRYLIEIDEKGRLITKQVGKGFTDLEKGAKRTGGVFKSMRSNWLALTAAMAAGIYTVVKLTKSFMNLAKAYGEQEAAENALMVAMKNAGTYTEANFEMLKKYAAQLQQVTTYGDEVTISTMANLQAYGMNTEQLRLATKATMDLATAKKIDLRTASELIGKAFVGETGTLSRYGIIIDKTLKRGEKFSAVLKMIQKSFGGAATAEVDTYLGRLKQLENVWGDLKELLGKELIPYIEKVVIGLKNWILANQELIKQDIRALFEGIANAISMMADAYKRFHLMIDPEKATALDKLEERLRKLRREYIYWETMKPAGPLTFLFEGKNIKRLRELTNEIQRVKEQILELRMLEKETKIPTPKAPAAYLPIRPAAIEEPLMSDKELEAQERRIDLNVQEIETMVSLAEFDKIRLEGMKNIGTAYEDQANKVNILSDCIRELGGVEYWELQFKMALQQAIVSAILGYESLEKALKKAIAGMLANLAAQAAVKAIWEVAEGFAALARYDPVAASLHFKSAALYGAVALAAGVAAHMLAASTGGASAAESAGYAEARGAGVQQVATATEPGPYPQKIEVHIINPIGEQYWVENNLIPALRKVAKRDTSITIRYD